MHLLNINSKCSVTVYLYIYVCVLKASSHKLDLGKETYERETYKRKYKVLLSEDAMHSYGLRLSTSIPKTMCKCISHRGQILKLAQA